MAHDDMIGSILMGRLGLGTIRINPGMKLHTATMTLVYHPLQGVPIGIRLLALLTRQIVAPRLQRALIEGVAFRTNLKNDGITAVVLQDVELMGQCTLHGFSADTLELAVDTLNPGASKLAFLLR